LTVQERPVEIPGDGLRLEGALHEGATPLAAVILHPHPQYGGDMDNHVVLAARGAFADAGATTLRFNFRGTGRSDGAFDNGPGEADDARAAIRLVRDCFPEAGLVLVGYSFGALVAARVAADAAIRAFVLVSPPVAFAPLPPLPDSLPALLLTGELDEVAPPAALCALAAPARRIAVVSGAGHAWWPGVDRLRAELSAFAAGLATG